jgi:hypothetical protein
VSARGAWALRLGRVIALGLLCVLFGSAVDAADRHVYLNSSGGGSQLNDCPNPAHNAKGTSNTDELQYCAGGSQAGKIIGTVTGTVTSSTCTSGGGTVTAVTNGVQADVDRDGTAERVYGHPQACVWNMAPSDSCEVHAGVYRNAGAGIGTGANSTGNTQCDIFDCWLTALEFTGHGPNLNNNAYGTSGSPGYVRGAVMRGSTDTWDGDGDKIPDTVSGEPTSYPAILSGDRDNDGAFDVTTCSSQDANSCTGDTWGIAQIGCGQGSFGQIICGPNMVAPERGIMIDTNADGTFDQEISNLGASVCNGGAGACSGNRNVDNLVIKDLEFTKFNGGNQATSGAERHIDGRINAMSDGTGVGIVIDHIYQHNNDFPWSSQFGDPKSRSAEWADYLNGDCRASAANNYTVYRNSTVEVNARYFYQNDNEDTSHAGCSARIHDNRIIFNAVNNPSRATRTIAFYLKAIDQNGGGFKKVHRIYNNEFIIQQFATGGETGGVDLAAFSGGNGTGLGELWFYGNLFRRMPNATGANVAEWWVGYCNCDGSGGAGCGTGGRVYVFNNTWDWAIPMRGVCEHSSAGAQEFLREKNNAYFGPTSLYADTTSKMGSIVRSDNCLSTSPINSGPDDCPSDTKSNWFADTSSSVTWWNGAQLYRAKPGGDLAGRGSCDPDGDGVAGVDYDGDGANDTTWRDLNGSLVTCNSLSSPMDIGAIQATTATGDTVPPGTVTGVTRIDAKP